MPVTASTLVHRAPARAWTRGSPNRKAGALLPSSVRVGCAIRSKAGLARTQPWPTRSVSSSAVLTARARACSSSRWTRRRRQPRSSGSLIDGLDAQRAPVLQILFDAGVPVEGVDVDLGAVGDDLGLVLAGLPGVPGAGPVGRSARSAPGGRCRGCRPPGPRRTRGRGAARRRPGCARSRPGASTAPTNSRRRGRLGQRQRQHRPPAFEEHPDAPGPEPVADRLQRGRIAARGEPVGQLGEPDPGLGWPAVWPTRVR